jgi:hypothetical protein
MDPPAVPRDVFRFSDVAQYDAKRFKGCATMLHTGLMESYPVACSVKRRVTPFWNKRPGSEPLNNQNNQNNTHKAPYFSEKQVF